jgi:predicted phosphodiesterase
MRRLALFSDVHANADALDVVLADIEQAGPDDVYCLGDVVGYGPDPARTIATLRSRDVPVVQGNYDRGVGGLLGDCGCYYATEQARSDGAASYEFTTQALDGPELEWLSALPEELRVDHDGVRILLAHGSPRKVNEYLMPDRPSEQLVRLARAADAEVVCVGHVHVPYHRRLDTPDGPVHYVNSGSVGKPKDGDPRACWIELVVGDEAQVVRTASEDEARGPAGSGELWVGMLVHRVDYDIEAVAARMIDAGLPPTLAEALRSG